MGSGFEVIFLSIISLVACLIILGTIIAVVIIMRKPASAKSGAAKQSRPAMSVDSDMSEADLIGANETIQLSSPTPSQDVEEYLLQQQKNLAEFELKDLSTTFKGSTNNGQRSGVILHLTQPDTALITFNSQVYNAKNGSISADTVYGKLELIIAQGRAGVQFEGAPLGILEYSKQRILGAEGQLLGSMERPVGDMGGAEIKSYPIGFYGKKVADLNTTTNALSTLRWFGGDEIDPIPAFSDLADDLEDTQTLLLLGTLILEIGFFDVL